jgi:hypothetical protein
VPHRRPRSVSIAVPAAGGASVATSAYPPEACLPTWPGPSGQLPDQALMGRWQGHLHPRDHGQEATPADDQFCGSATILHVHLNMQFYIRQLTDVSVRNLQQNLSCNQAWVRHTCSDLGGRAMRNTPNRGWSNLDIEDPMNTTAPARAAELHKCPVQLTMGPATAAEAHGTGRRTICARNAPAAKDAAVLLPSELATNAVRHTAGETATPGIPCTPIQLSADVHDISVCMPVLADAGGPGPRDRGRACRGTAGSEYRSMAGPSGEFGEVAGNPIKPGSAGEPG